MTDGHTKPASSSSAGALNENTTGYDWTATRGARWAAQVAGMEATLAPVEAPLLEALRLDARYRIADIGSGGGATTFDVARAAPAGSVVHGYDISPVLVAAARARIGSATGVAFLEANTATSTPAAPYDRLVSRFGIMFFDDAPAAFANLARWLVPGGRFAFAAWGPTAENPWRVILREVVSAFVEIPTPKPDDPGPFRYGDAEKFLAILRGAGFRDVEAHEWRGALPIGGALSAPDAARFALAAFSSLDELLAKSGAEALQGAQRALTERFAKHEVGGAVKLDAFVRVFTGAR
ncbi:MAG TPA: class I SAM-dependent methyltransferase [Polyangiaceae bacterium]|jgi:SAM-dependent methyltransferase|nr:class I SAM-dependent methyltransferase [Polyangiaceae bacterium]